jgi:glutaredoxin 3
MANVTIYTRAFCGFCSRAKALLEEKGVQYEEIDAGMDPIKRKEMMQRSGGATTFPQIFVGARYIGGCDDMLRMDRDGKLDVLLNA